MLTNGQNYDTLLVISFWFGMPVLLIARAHNMFTYTIDNSFAAHCLQSCLP